MNDNEGERRILRKILSNEGYEAIATPSHFHAMAYLPDDINVVLTDVHLRDNKSGLDILLEWRQVRPDTVFVVMIANGEPIKPAVDAGAYLVLMKPFETERLLAVIANAMAVARGLRQ